MFLVDSIIHVFTQQLTIREMFVFCNGNTIIFSLPCTYKVFVPDPVYTFHKGRLPQNIYVRGRRIMIEELLEKRFEQKFVGNRGGSKEEL